MEKDIKKMSFEEIEQYIKELERYKRLVTEIGKIQFEEYKDLLIKERIKQNPNENIKQLLNVGVQIF